MPSNERANRRADHVDRRRAQILDAARRVVLERGMGNTRVADIAEAVNVSGGLIHYHFATKEELMAEMLRATSDGEIRHLDAIVSGPGTAIDGDRVLRPTFPEPRARAGSSGSSRGPPYCARRCCARSLPSWRRLDRAIGRSSATGVKSGISSAATRRRPSGRRPPRAVSVRAASQALPRNDSLHVRAAAARGWPGPLDLSQLARRAVDRGGQRIDA